PAGLSAWLDGKEAAPSPEASVPETGSAATAFIVPANGCCPDGEKTSPKPSTAIHAAKVSFRKFVRFRMFVMVLSFFVSCSHAHQYSHRRDFPTRRLPKPGPPVAGHRIAIHRIINRRAAAHRAANRRSTARRDRKSTR